VDIRGIVYAPRTQSTTTSSFAPPAVADALAKQGRITAGGSPEFLGELVERDMAKWQKLIRRAGITAE